MDQQQFQDKLHQIDQKYDRHAHEVEIDLPESLGLTKMDYQAPTEQQLQQRAEQAVSPKYDEKILKATTDSENERQKIESKVAEEEIDYGWKTQEERRKFDEKVKKLLDGFVRRGVGQSSLAKQAEAAAEAEHLGAETHLQRQHLAKTSAFSEALDRLEEETEQVLANLDDQKDAAVAEKMAALLKEVRRAQNDVLKYNNSVDEHEANFTVRKERARVAAQNSESSRALRAATLYATIGIDGINDMKLDEKVAVCRAYFSQFPRQTAVALFNADESLEYHLGKYYSYVKSYVESLPETV